MAWSLPGKSQLHQENLKAFLKKIGAAMPAESISLLMSLKELFYTGISGLRTQVLDAGLWKLDSGFWNLEAGLWTLDPGLWTLDAESWMLDSGCYT